MKRLATPLFVFLVSACQVLSAPPTSVPLIATSTVVSVSTPSISGVGDLGSKTIGGTVRSADNRLIPGATITCTHFSYVPRTLCAGTRTSAADGTFSFGAIFLHDTDQITVRVQVAGFAQGEIKRTGLEAFSNSTFDFVLRPDASSKSSDLGAWTSGAPFRVSRGEVAAATTGERIYVIGGFGGSDVVEEYSREQIAWVQRANLPLGLNHPAAVGLNGKLYVVGGYQDDGAPTPTLFEFDPAQNRWSALAPMPTARGALGAVALDGRIYAVGGTLRGDVGALQVYDPARDAWEKRAEMPTPRDHIAVAVVRGKIYVIGGRIESAARNLNVNEEYDPQTNAWRVRAQLPTARSGIAAAVLKEMVFVFGGESPQKTFNENEAYDPATDSWKTFAPMPTARHGIAAVTFDGKVFVLAGGRTPGGSDSTLVDIFSLP
jgi:N-acetylneuraminic acid mutarotase